MCYYKEAISRAAMLTCLLTTYLTIKRQISVTKNVPAGIKIEMNRLFGTQKSVFLCLLEHIHDMEYRINEIAS